MSIENTPEDSTRPRGSRSAGDRSTGTGRDWRLIETYDVAPEYAMGLDEALLRSVGAPPTLRLYTWRPDAVSLGYFQAFEDVPAAARHGSVVRRLTGGGAIHHHAGELTFSVAIDADDPAYRGSVPDSYERSHAAIMGALESVGVRGVRMRRGEPCASDVAGSGMCFHESTPQDICWLVPRRGLAKGVGTAQRRSATRVLHHGSIKIETSALEPETASLFDAGVVTTPRALGGALRLAFERTFGVSITPGPLAPDEAADAVALGNRYSDPAFVHRTVRRRRSQ